MEYRLIVGLDGCLDSKSLRPGSLPGGSINSKAQPLCPGNHFIIDNFPMSTPMQDMRGLYFLVE